VFFRNAQSFSNVDRTAKAPWRFSLVEFTFWLSSVSCDVSLLDDFVRMRLYRERAAEFELLAENEPLSGVRFRYRIIARHYRELADRDEREHYAARLNVLDQRSRSFCTVVLGVVMGVLVTLTSVGAGAIGVTVLLLLHPKMPAGRVVGSVSLTRYR
jgi:hypothetical protein